VFHCHKLTHEDEGMMQLIRVCDPATDATCGDYGWQECPADDLDCVQAREATECTVAATNADALAACAVALGSPAGVCGVNACTTTDDCTMMPGATCQDNVCSP
jgi:hypothetical protein